MQEKILGWPKIRCVRYQYLEKDIKQGFQECMRVLEDCGVLIFKWNDEQIKFGEILKVIDYKPLFGDKRGKTRWTVFMKENENE